jgi:hypothetical protein
VAAWELLTAAGANADSLKDKWGRTAADVARLNGWSVVAPSTSTSGSQDSSDASNSKGTTLVPQPSAEGRRKTLPPNTATTAVISHPSCVRHYTCPPSETEETSAPPENIRRLKVLLDGHIGALRSTELEQSLAWFPESKAAALTDVLRVHEWQYIKQMQVGDKTDSK